jgi:type I restriction enzyme S subunit
MVPYLRAANVKDGALELSDVKSMNFSPTEQRFFSLRPSDVLVTEGSGSLATVGASATWSGDLPGTICFQNTLLRLRPRSEATDPRFLAWWARHAFASGIFASIATGANIFHVSAERVRSLPVWFPSLADQRRIADLLDSKVARIDELVARKNRMIRLNLQRFNIVTRDVLTRRNWPIVPLKRRWVVVDCKHRTPDYAEEKDFQLLALVMRHRDGWISQDATGSSISQT